MSKKTLPRYSGRLSKPFWDRVNDLPEGPWQRAAYMTGLVLQDLEARVLQFLTLAEQEPPDAP